MLKDGPYRGYAVFYFSWVIMFVVLNADFKRYMVPPVSIVIMI